MNIFVRICRIVCAWQVLLTMLLSGLFINALQAVFCFAIFIPRYYRMVIVQSLANIYWHVLDFSIINFCGIRIVFSGHQLPQNMGKSDKCGIMMGNHGAGLDFMTGVLVANRTGVGCGRVTALMKFVLVLLPGVGWTQYLQGGLFLQRNWETDRHAFDKKLQEMDCGLYPRPFLIGIYPEGTRISPAKREESHAFSRERGLPVLNHVLLPRSKGFANILSSLPHVLEYILDVTVAYDPEAAYLRDILMWGVAKTRVIHLNVEIHDVADVPKDPEAVSKWLIKLFQRKDHHLTYFKKHCRFQGGQYEVPFTKARKFFVLLGLIPVVVAFSQMYLARSFTAAYISPLHCMIYVVVHILSVTFGCLPPFDSQPLKRPVEEEKVPTSTITPKVRKRAAGESLDEELDRMLVDAKDQSRRIDSIRHRNQT
eukprot:272082_1